MISAWGCRLVFRAVHRDWRNYNSSGGCSIEQDRLDPCERAGSKGACRKWCSHEPCTSFDSFFDTCWGAMDINPPQLDRMKATVRHALRRTRFCDAPMVGVAAAPGKGEGETAESADSVLGITELLALLRQSLPRPHRDPSGSFLLAADHCFSVKGKVRDRGRLFVTLVPSSAFRSILSFLMIRFMLRLRRARY